VLTLELWWQIIHPNHPGSTFISLLSFLNHPNQVQSLQLLSLSCLCFFFISGLTMPELGFSGLNIAIQKPPRKWRIGSRTGIPWALFLFFTPSPIFDGATSFICSKGQSWYFGIYLVLELIAWTRSAQYLSEIGFTLSSWVIPLGADIAPVHDPVKFPVLGRKTWEQLLDVVVVDWFVRVLEIVEVG
jgi:hypothetical protein